MVPIWSSVALGSVFSTSIAAASSQYNPHLGLNKQDQDALATHRLTIHHVWQMFGVDRDLLQLLRDLRRWPRAPPN